MNDLEIYRLRSNGSSHINALCKDILIDRLLMLSGCVFMHKGFNHCSPDTYTLRQNHTRVMKKSTTHQQTKNTLKSNLYLRRKTFHKNFKHFMKSTFSALRMKRGKNEKSNTMKYQVRSKALYKHIFSARALRTTTTTMPAINNSECSATIQKTEKKTKRKKKNVFLLFVFIHPMRRYQQSTSSSLLQYMGERIHFQNVPYDPISVRHCRFDVKSILLWSVLNTVFLFLLLLKIPFNLLSNLLYMSSMIVV